MTIEAVGEYVLLRKISESERDVDGIIIPNSQQSLLSKGKILSVGMGKKVDLLSLYPGDIVYYNEVESNTVASDGTSDGAYFVRQDFIMGKENN